MISCAEHGAVASASPRDGSWQLQVHLLIARRAARSDLTVRSDRVHASRSNGEGYDVRFFTCAQPEGGEGACVHRCEVHHDGRHRRRPCGVYPTGSEDFRYLFSYLHCPRAAALHTLWVSMSNRIVVKRRRGRRATRGWKGRVHTAPFLNKSYSLLKRTYREPRAAAAHSTDMRIAMAARSGLSTQQCAATLSLTSP